MGVEKFAKAWEQDQPFCRDIWADKYRFTPMGGATAELHPLDTIRRVVDGVYRHDPDEQARAEAFAAIAERRFIPGGRILADAGTGKTTTSINCFVMDTLPDDLAGIFRVLSESALTMQQGGGIGVDFSTLRPKGALLVRTHTFASGPLSFMDAWDAMCRTIMSAGHRRGAMMATMRCDHPDVREFIRAKREKGRLTNFNVSVLTTDLFMASVKADAMWALGFPKPRLDGRHVSVEERDGAPWYVYEVLPARALWDEILRSTYDHAEPGVIFIDRINAWNNLAFCEQISCTNPCFAADTLIATRAGARRISDLVGEAVEIWDGSAWREIENFRVTGRYQRMLKIGLHDGSELRVTPAHTMILEDGSRVPAAKLGVGDRLALSDLEYDGPLASSGAYLKGFLLGDGSIAGDQEVHPTLYLYEPKAVCRARIEASALSVPVGDVRTSAVADLGWRRDETERQSRDAMRGLTVRKADLLQWCTIHRNGLPDEAFCWDRDTKLDFIAGLFDADGTALDTENGFAYQLSSISRRLLQDVQVLLKSIGVRSHLSLMKSAGRTEIAGGVYETKECWRLTISQGGAIRLSLQVRFERLASFADRKLAYKLRPRAGRVVSIADDGVDEVVYCCTVPETHSVALGVGLVTGQCGEEPLPPYGDCNLGSINLAAFVLLPWTSGAIVDWDGLAATARVGMRFLDNVIDATGYPLPEQEREAKAKRRTGLGVMGLANMLQQLQLPYGSEMGRKAVERVMATIRNAAYFASARLAAQRGPFPAYQPKHFIERPFIKDLPHLTQQEIAAHGIRNGVLLTVAPTGTTAIFAGNVSGGVEPVFAHRYTRRVRQADDSLKPEAVSDWGWREYCAHHGLDPAAAPLEGLPDYMATAQDLPVEAHVQMQATVQRYIDASISKTINCPAEISFEDFRTVYDQAYELGCKGCTTYRPSEVRGAVLEVEAKPQEAAKASSAWARPRVLSGRTYKIKPDEHALYVTITDGPDGRPAELFITTKNAAVHDWTQLTGRLLSALMRHGIDVGFLADEMQQVFSARGGFWEAGHYRASIPAAIGAALAEHMGLVAASPASDVEPVAGEPCPKCQRAAVVHESGCRTCRDCGWSSCG